MGWHQRVLLCKPKKGRYSGSAARKWGGVRVGSRVVRGVDDIILFWREWKAKSKKGVEITQGVKGKGGLQQMAYFSPHLPSTIEGGGWAMRAQQR